MPSTVPIPVAQYLRMSRESQDYSMENQKAAIQEYAQRHGFAVVQTHADAGKSGLVLRRRAGLSRLLQDVVGGTPVYKAILVYDISCWGRFQDVDEAAHYEFLCRHAGIPVHYCAEQFANDGTLPASILKALKRTMAAEYSRELGVKLGRPLLRKWHRETRRPAATNDSGTACRACGQRGWRRLGQGRVADLNAPKRRTLLVRIVRPRAIWEGGIPNRNRGQRTYGGGISAPL